MSRGTSPRVRRAPTAGVARAAGAVVVLGALVLRFGGAPFAEGVRALHPGLVVLALTLTAVATLCCAWRWRVVAGTLGVVVPLRAAFAACYRSQLLNTALPAGVLGDVDRAVGLGRRVGRPGRAAGTVLWERGIGLGVQVVVTVLALVVLQSPLLAPVLLVGAGAMAVLGVLVALGRRLGLRRAVRTVLDDVRRLLGAPRATVVAGAASFGVTACHAGVMAAAVHLTAGDVPVQQLAPLVLVVQLGAAVPTNVGGWGPREGVAAWAYGVLGLDPAAGIAASVVYGVAATLAVAPAAVALALRVGGPARVREGADVG
jgi:uncharacterized membrane protein YbhN (UPF0104 family)